MTMEPLPIDKPPDPTLVANISHKTSLDELGAEAPKMRCFAPDGRAISPP